MDEKQLERHHHFIDKIAVFAGIASGLALYPQGLVALIVSSVLNALASAILILLIF